LDGRAKARQGEPGPLAAGQHADRGAGLLRAEQEVLHVADHVSALATDRHRIAAAAGQRLRQTLFRVEAFAPLIERDLHQVGAEPHFAGIRRKRAGQQVEQRGLAGAVRADDPDAVAPHDPHRKIPHDQMIVIGFGDALRRGNEPAGQIRLRRFEPGRAGRAAMVSSLAPQCVQLGESLAGPRRVSRDTAAEHRFGG
jgi:hypothetical protein